MKRFFTYFMVLLLLVIYIYSIVFKLVPISTKIILEGFSFLYCVVRFNAKYKLKKEYKSICQVIILIVIWDFLTCTFNLSLEFHFSKVAIPIIGGIFASHIIYTFSRKLFSGADMMLSMVVVTIFLESILTIAMKVVPPIYEFVSSLLVFELGDKDVRDIYDLARFYGIGNAIYFGVLPSCSLGVITSVYLLMKTNKAKYRLLTIVMYLVIAITSFFVARTALFIIALSIILLFVYAIHAGIGKVFRISALLCIAVFIAYGIVLSFTDENAEFQKWAFGFIQDQDLETGTAGTVLGWWHNTSFDFKTFLIGDAQYFDPHGGYYKHVDVGFFREIFYGGIIGLGLNLYLHYMVLSCIYRICKNKQTKYMLISLFICYLIIMAKGDANMVSLFVLYLCFYTGGVYERRNFNKSFSTCESNFSIEKTN